MEHNNNLDLEIKPRGGWRKNSIFSIALTMILTLIATVMSITPQAMAQTSERTVSVSAKVGSDRDIPSKGLVARNKIKPLAGATVAVMKASSAASFNKTTLQQIKDQAVGTGKTDASGNVKIDVPFNAEGYFVAVVDAPAGYAVADKISTSMFNADNPREHPYAHYTGKIGSRTTSVTVPNNTGLNALDTQYGPLPDVLGIGGALRMKYNLYNSMMIVPRENPDPTPETCFPEMDLVLLADFSQSTKDYSNGSPILDRRRNSVYNRNMESFVEQLRGTNTKIQFRTFSHSAPNAHPLIGQVKDPKKKFDLRNDADVNELKKSINDQWTMPLGGTNWDGALIEANRIAQDDSVVIMATDGMPTFDGSMDPLPYTELLVIGVVTAPYKLISRAEDTELAAASANTLKGRGIPVIAAGMGKAVNNTWSDNNLKFISGKTKGKDYYKATEWDQLADTLMEIPTSLCQPALDFTKTSDPVSGTEVNDDENITYTVTAKNSGGVELDTTITDDLSKVLNHTELVDGPNAPKGDAKINGTTMTWKGKLAPGESVDVEYTVKMKSNNTPVSIINTAFAEGVPPAGFGEKITTPKESTTHNTPGVQKDDQRPGYNFTKTSDPVSGTEVNPGDTITYKVTGNNTGKKALSTVIKDDMSEVLKYADLQGEPEANTGSLSVDGTDINWNGSLAVGQSVDITYTVKVKDGVSGVLLKNKASSTATPPGGDPINPPDVSVEHPVPGDPGTPPADPGYRFTKTSDPESGTAVESGEMITYKVTGKNTGGTKLDTVIKDDMSEVLKYADLQGDPKSSKGSVNVDGANLSWNGSLNPGESVDITYTVKVKDGVSGVLLKNKASSTATPPGQPSITPPDVSVEHPVPSPSYEFTKTSDPVGGTSVNSGDTITYTVTGRNTGDSELDVNIADDMSGVLNYADIVAQPQSDKGGAPSVDGANISWSGKLAAGESVNITYTVKVKDGISGVSVLNKASSTATPPGGDPINPPDVSIQHPVPGVPNPPARQVPAPVSPSLGAVVPTKQTPVVNTGGSVEGKGIMDRIAALFV